MKTYNIFIIGVILVVLGAISIMGYFDKSEPIQPPSLEELQSQATSTQDILTQKVNIIGNAVIQHKQSIEEIIKQINQNTANINQLNQKIDNTIDEFNNAIRENN